MTAEAWRRHAGTQCSNFSSTGGVLVVRLLLKNARQAAEQANPTPMPPLATQSPTPSRNPRSSSTPVATPSGASSSCSIGRFVSYPARFIDDKLGRDWFFAGTRVRLVEDKGETIVVTDGTVKIEVPADILTNDLDIATFAARQDAQAQQALATYLANQEAIDQAAREKRNETFDREQHEAAVSRQSAAVAAKGSNPLSRGAYHQTYSYPYYYPYYYPHRWIYYSPSP